MRKFYNTGQTSMVTNWYQNLQAHTCLVEDSDRPEIYLMTYGYWIIRYIFKIWEDQGLTIVKYPVESLPEALHSVNGNVLYKVLAKKFIGEINVSQAKILSEFEPPCVVKANLGSDADRVYFAHTKEEYGDAMDDMELPSDEFVITELIKDIKITNCAHFYVTKKGEVQWISAAVQYLPGERAHGQMEWFINMDDQPALKELLYPVCKILGEALHKAGYFGYCGTDIVLDKNDVGYVVDINPRSNGSTGLQLSSLFLNDQKGYTTGSQREMLKSNISLDDLIKKIENVKNGVAVLVYALPFEKGLQFCIRVHSTSQDAADKIYDDILTT